MLTTRSKAVHMFLFGLFTLGVCLITPKQANAQVIANIDHLANPGYFTCEAAGTVDPPTTSEFRWYVQIDGGTVFNATPTSISGREVIDVGGTYPSAILHGNHTCHFYGVLEEGFPYGRVTIWDVTDSYTFP